MLSAQMVSKSFSGVKVLSDASLELRSGRIHSIVGENGAGKSTLLKILAGIYQADSGSVHVNGSPVHWAGTREAIRSGVVMVHQELALVSGMSIADNILLVRPPESPWRHRGSRRADKWVSDAVRQVGLKRSVDTPVADLSIAEAYLVEIAKALVLNAKAVLFDEPTAALPPDASARMLEQLLKLKDQGTAVALTTHRMDEVLAVSDEITVLRDGCLVAEFGSDALKDDLIRAMVDRPVGSRVVERHPVGSQVVLSATGLSSDEVSGIEFDLRAGEVLGFAGLIGSGRTEAALVITGRHKRRSGVVSVDGEELPSHNYHASRARGVVLVPEDRHREGIVAHMSVHDNLHLGNFASFSRMGMLLKDRLQAASRQSQQRFDIRARSLGQSMGTLSGGNQQKALLARAVEAHPRVLILDEPTRGVDIHAKSEIHRQLSDLAASGIALIVISSELEEVLALSHRIAVFAERRMTGVVDNQGEDIAHRVMQLASPSKETMNGAK
ncbi:MAG: sugar ABC transporter ATP-binding protein [Actinomycetes bacterium]